MPLGREKIWRFLMKNCLATSKASPRSISGVILAAVTFCFLIGCQDESDTRPLGQVQDIRTLAEREDVNVLFILVDTLRADRLGSYGYDRETTANIDELARTGIRMTNHVAQSSWTKCSMASLWTGLYPSRTGVRRAQHALPEEAALPAEILHEAGFRTAGIHRNGWVAENFGFGQGFEVYMMPAPHGKAQEVLSQNAATIAGSDEDIMRSALQFLRVHSEERFFLYLHLLDVHQYASDETSAIFGTRYSDIYDNALHWTDRLVGHIVSELDKLGIRDRTLIVFASDHGEAFGEHQGEGHARDVYGEVIETPLILSFPFRLEPGIEVLTRTENVDLWPTVLDILGLPELDDPDGHSLLAAIELAESRDPESPEPTLDTAFAQIDHAWGKLEIEEQKTIVAVSDGPWRMIYNETRPGVLELFNKEVDPGEQRNVAARRPARVAELLSKVEAYTAAKDAPWGESPMIEIDEMQMRQLRAIGYGVE